VILISFFLLWEFASRMYWIDPLLFSSPSHVIALLQERFTNGVMMDHIQITLFETVLGFIIGTILGIVLAKGLWSLPRFSKIMDPYHGSLSAIPKVALGPIDIGAFVPWHVTIIAMGTFISNIITSCVVYSAVKEVDPIYVKVLQ